MSYIAWFGELPDENLGLIAGGKGASLCRMFQNGFPVPEGFICCSEMFSDFMESNHLWDKVYEKLESIDWDSCDSLAQTGEAIRRMVAEAPMPQEMAELLVENYRQLGDNVPVAVRSSGTAEDLDDASFAGQQETYLYVIGEEEVVSFVKECWASLYNDCAIFYRKEKKFDEREISIAVVVMRMVNSEKSGVMFSANPITKSCDACMIEAAWGLGEGVVQGIVNPDNYIVRKKDYGYDMRYISEKEIMVVRASERGGSKEIPVPQDKMNAPVLSDKEIGELVDLAVLVETFYGKPQDLEWAYEKGKMYLLQARPITTL